MSQQYKKENLHKKVYYSDCRAYPSKEAVLADMKKRRDRLRQLVGYAEKELDTLKSAESYLSARICDIENDIRKGKL
ncbi:MAG: hypothetical protein ACI4SF_02930 [Oscillospiraceae bacterium]